MLKYITLLTFSLIVFIPNSQASENNDWLESYNRSMFEFNYQLDKYAFKPLAKGYRAITTPDMRYRVDSFIDNIREPLTVVNHTLQGNIKETFVSLGRFLINSTLGLGGMFDVASGWGLKKNLTGFDDTLAHYCVPDGPFIVVPILGPFTPRSLASYTADAFVSPMYWLPRNDKNYADKISFSYAAIVAIHARERGLDLLDDLERGSVDYYSTIRSAYIQNRQKLNNYCSHQNQNNTPSYDFDFDVDEEFEFE